MSLFDPLLGADEVAAELSDGAWVRALLRVEGELTTAAARHGMVDPIAAARVAGVASSLIVDPDELGRAAVAGGNPVIPLVAMLRAACPGDEAAVHPGATSQDIMDTAMVLLIRAGTAVIVRDLRDCARAFALPPEVGAGTPMIARTLGQWAEPTTVGLVAANWVSGLERARTALATLVAALPVQFGGAAGTLAASYPHGLDVGRALADALGLAWAPPWHTERTRIGELAGALGVVAGVCAKVAGDVILLSGNEVGEVSEAAPGGSSSMPHKRNSIAAITARAQARRAPGLVATLLASMESEHQRAAGAWHTEWPTMTDLLRTTGGAAARLRVCATGLDVHAGAMAAHVRVTGRNHAGELAELMLDREEQK